MLKITTFRVATDASNTALGVVLLQDQENVKYPVIYLSRKSFPWKRNLSSVYKECLVIIWALDKLRPYVLGQAFTLCTNHRALM